MLYKKAGCSIEWLLERDLLTIMYNNIQQCEEIKLAMLLFCIAGNSI